MKTNQISKFFAEVASKAAKVGAGTASAWGAYQPAEPKKVNQSANRQHRHWFMLPVFILKWLRTMEKRTVFTYFALFLPQVYLK